MNRMCSRNSCLLLRRRAMTSLVAQTVKRLPPMQETQIQSLGWEDPLEKEMVTHSSILAWKIPWMEEPGRLHTVHGVTKSQTWLNNFTFRQYIKKQRHHFANKGPYSQSYGFSSSHVWTWRLDHKEGWTQKNWCLRILVLEKILESPLGNKIKPVNPKGNQSQILTGRTDAEGEAPILWPPDVKSWFTGKDPDAGKDSGQEEGGERGWDGWMDHQLNGHEFKQTLGDSEGQGNLASCSPCGCKESDTA